MSDFITLACPSCGGSLRLTSDIDRFACKYCGREHILRKQVTPGGQVLIDAVPVVKHLAKMTRNMDRYASELAIRRLRGEREELKDRIAERRRALWNAIDIVQSARRWITISCVLLVLGGGITAGFAFTNGMACFALVVGVAVVLPSSLTLVLQLSTLSEKKRWRANARRKLDNLYDVLDECEEELAFHEDVVRR